MPKADYSKTLECFVTETSSGQRLDKFLCEFPEIATRSKAALLIEKQAVTLNGKSVKASLKVASGQCFVVQIPEPESSTLDPLDLPLDVVYEDSDCLVVNKPAGLVVHPAAGHRQDTLVNVLIARIKDLAMGFGEHRPGIVHRLDRDTSGLLVAAKNNRAQEILASQFKARTVDRHYWALAHGEFKNRKGRIESTLGRHPTQRKKFATRPNGKRAVTHYEVLKTVGEVSLVRCRLETGRTHQIRVHLSELGHPLLGDMIYGSSRWTKRLGKPVRERVENLNRIGLHAYELGFAQPSTGERLRFLAGWPAELQSIVEKLGFSDVSTVTAQK